MIGRVYIVRVSADQNAIRETQYLRSALLNPVLNPALKPRAAKTYGSGFSKGVQGSAKGGQSTLRPRTNLRLNGVPP